MIVATGRSMKGYQPIPSDEGPSAPAVYSPKIQSLKYEIDSNGFLLKIVPCSDAWQLEPLTSEQFRTAFPKRQTVYLFAKSSDFDLDLKNPSTLTPQQISQAMFSGLFSLVRLPFFRDDEESNVEVCRAIFQELPPSSELNPNFQISLSLFLKCLKCMTTLFRSNLFPFKLPTLFSKC